MGDGPTPARLPSDAPAALKEFVACTVDSAELDTESLGWVPSGGMGDSAPSITITPGATAQRATVRVGWEYIGIDLPASIGGEGQLVVDTSGIPGIASEVKDGVDRWVKAFNDTMAANGKRLDGFTIFGAKVTLTKRVVAGATPPVAAPPVVAAPPATGGATTQPAESEPATPPSTDRGCLAWLLGAAVVLALLVAGVFILVRDGGDSTTEISPSTPASDPATAPATDTPLATDASPTADGPASTEPAVTQQAPPDTGAPPETGTAGDGDDAAGGAQAPEPFAGVFDDLDDAFGDEQLTGSVVFVSPGSVGNVVDCATQNAVDVPGADVVGVVGTTDGATVDVAVLMGQSPMLTAEDFSFAVLLQVLTSGNTAQLYQWEIHDGERSTGRRDDAGNVDPAGADVALTERAVRFSFPVDPNDPIAVVFARGFNTPVGGGATGCDEELAAPIDFPVRPTDVSGDCTADATTACLNNRRFAASVVGPDGHMPVISPGLDDTSGYGPGEDAQAWVRVLNGCGLNDHFWVVAATSTDVDVAVTVSDTAVEEVAFDSISLGAAAPIVDTTAFATCP